ncbi:MAG TPA: phosphatidylglycerol lysyltransferase domain-containing protein [Candidatus Saccharimonadales bacterium]|jgi:phosphatidylglycerol lysyltransferase|nr:phosphatidylglycerol lysyltransferase domain-containing protein [Candidatus Saccharimonadales bacterium]
MLPATLKTQLKIHRQFAVQLLGVLVSAHGLYILAAILLVQTGARRGTHISDIFIDLPLLIGLSLVYLGGLLRRRKRTAWLVTVMAYTFYLGLGVAQLINRTHLEDVQLHELTRTLLLPIVVLGLLMAFQREFVVKSDVQGFGFAARFSAVILLIAVFYGVIGFSLLDHSDFHQEIGVATATHYTIDQFNLTTNKPVKAYTRRAHLFLDSLSFISTAAVAYALISLFQPLRARFADQAHEREQMKQLLEQYGGPSEEFFKLWPDDKHYIFDDSGQSGLAFHVSRGVALCLADPVGKRQSFPKLMSKFDDLCFGNDWLPAFIHIEDKHRQLYEKHDFALQKLGQEAVLDLKHFRKEVAGTKYFRQIRNKFNRHDYSYELLEPPHHKAVIDRLQEVSNEWLGHDGRVERGFVMGYFTPDYMQMCRLMVARDAAGTIQGFVNLLPTDFDKQEATFDMLRHSNKSLGNINDYLLMALIDYSLEKGYEKLNLGLCALVGLDEEPDEEKNRVISNFLSFAYANGDRFYSFQGLYKFKAKYEPEWRDRYIAYQGGIRGFTRTMTALMRAMRI